MEDCKEFDILIVTTTVASAQDAEGLAREIMARRLAACVQVEGGLRSFYHWEGRLCDEPEWRLVIKSIPAGADRLRALLAEIHPYDLPQFTAWTAQASADYAAWVRAEVAQPS
jgi:periplasmic divalent cation tolerance protein